MFYSTLLSHIKIDIISGLTYEIHFCVQAMYTNNFTCILMISFHIKKHTHTREKERVSRNRIR